VTVSRFIRLRVKRSEKENVKKSVRAFSRFRCFTFQRVLCVSGSRTARFVAVFTEHAAAGLRLEWNTVVLPAIVADDLETRTGLDVGRRFFRTAFRTTLRRHHVPLIELLLLLLREDKNFFALHARNFYIRHRITSPCGLFVCANSSTL